MANHPFADKLPIAESALEPWPIVAETIVSGRPVASGRVLSQSQGGRIVRAIWDCTPGAFRWSWTYNETLVVLRGRAIVRFDDGRVLEVSAGDLAFIERGQSGVWETVTALRKAFHAHADEPMGF